MELLLPRRCAGCGVAGEVLCPRCRLVWAQPPQRVTASLDPLVPVWSMGVYGGPRQRTIVSLKERGNRAVAGHIGAALAAGLEYLRARGELPEEAVALPAPTRARSARLRGGDHVTACCRAAGIPVAAGRLRYRGGVHDSVGLSAQERRRNVAGAVRIGGVLPPRVVLIDDVLTTGATIGAAAALLLAQGIEVDGAVVWAHA
ncbi:MULTISPECIES: ComF family protein [unclassified Corynebacterium]|uniref:ComF family protein n=1 Tax=unclassified Corynebacterium TaxID=2624378 RepID=UPI0029C9F369|nr:MULTISPECIES: ComF family protein [unclassified Corynebacterium]WPF66645.1 ComF family protein [Corynebacterium sp. 22KM0430]WPF69133.1 ComF family protein [Corynebacterium sp. 21KM1197]